MFRLKLHAATFALVIGLLTAFNQTARAQAACTTNPVVVNVLDAGAGSLRQAVIDACSGSTITFSDAGRGTISLTIGQIVIDKNLTIAGPGADLLIVRYGAFIVNQGVTATISGLTIADVVGTGIVNYGNLTVRNSVITNNSISEAGSGGGILSSGGTLALVNSRVTKNGKFRLNHQGLTEGGGIALIGSTTTITDSTVSDNFGNNGGGIYALNSSVSITSSTIGSNSTFYDGGGLYLQGGMATLTNSTVSQNTAGDFGGGGGIFISDAALTLINTTVAGNQSGILICYYGGGICNWSGTVNARNSIIAGNRGFYDYSIFASDFDGTLTSYGYNLIGIGGTVTGDTTGNIVGVSDPHLGGLANNGGPTMTNALLPGSPAINTGNTATSPTFDQRGAARVGTADIGAFEVNNSATFSVQLPDGVVQTPYSYTITPDRGAFTYSLTGGALPTGISLSTNGAIVSVNGTPSVSGIFNFSVTATNGTNSFVTNYRLQIFALPNGYFDSADCNSIYGWAWDPRQPNAPISVNIYADDNLVATVSANQFRQDLLDAGIGNGVHGFSIATPANLKDGQPHQIRVRIVSTTSDIANSPKTITCATPPDLTITKTHTGNFTQSDTGKTYSIVVTNSGGTAASGAVSVTDSLPGGLAATGINGTGWNCNFANLTCTRNDALAAGGSYPAITLTVNVAANAPSSVTNFASVSGGGETNTGNNLAADQTTINAAPTPGNGIGLRGDYYNSIDLTGAIALSRIDPTINFDWGNGSPGPGVGFDNFSVRWSGQVEPAFTETYTFYTTTDDGVRLWINGVQVIDDWTNHAPVENSATVTLIAGQRYDIRIEYFDAAGGAVARLAWSSPSQSRQIIPADRLFPSPRYSISGTVTYGTTNVGQPDSFVSGVNFNATGSSSALAVSDGSGIYQLSNLLGGNYTVTPSKTGDVRGINSLDATRIQQHLVGMTTLTANQLVAADTDGSGTVNSLDATRIQQRAVGIQTSNIIGQWKFVPGSRQYNLTGNVNEQNYQAVLVGEVSGNWATAASFAENFLNEEENEVLPATDNQNQIAERFADKLLGGITENASPSSDSLSNESPIESFGNPNIQVTLPANVTGSNGSTVTIPINIGAIPAGTSIESFDFSVFYDPTVLQPATPAGSNAGTLSANCFVLSFSPVSGRVIVSGSCPQAITTGSGVLYNLTFNVIGSANQTTSLSFTNPANSTNTFQFNNGTPTVATANGQFTVLAPTAAGVSISGRVFADGGRGLTNAIVTITDATGETRTTRTSSFGYYRFDDVGAGQTYIIQVNSRRYSFAPQVVTITDDLTELNFTAL